MRTVAKYWWLIDFVLTYSLLKLLLVCQGFTHWYIHIWRNVSWKLDALNSQHQREATLGGGGCNQSPLSKRGGISKPGESASPTRQ